MSENKKQTLFRFKTLRSVELLSTVAKENYFITHPNLVSGPFFMAVAGKTPSQTKREVLLTAAASFTGKKTKEEILTINSDLSEFGLFLKKNRNKVTVSEITTEIAGLTTLPTAKVLNFGILCFTKPLH